MAGIDRIDLNDRACDDVAARAGNTAVAGSVAVFWVLERTAVLVVRNRTTGAAVSTRVPIGRI